MVVQQLFAFLVAIDEVAIRPSPFLLWWYCLTVFQYRSDQIPNLSGCVADMVSVRRYLVECLKVPSSRIRTLTNSDATRQDILSVFRQHLIHNDAIAKDNAILFYFAGHGSQAAAPEGWYCGRGNVETLCPHDETVQIEEQPMVSGIPDRTLWALLRELTNTRNTANITIILDCGHSGNGNYGERGTVRGYGKSRAIPASLDREIWGRFTEQHIQTVIPSGFLYRNYPYVWITACRQVRKSSISAFFMLTPLNM
jgi:hypothetical protein